MLGVAGDMVDSALDGCGLEVINEGAGEKAMDELTTWRFSRASRFG
jgi:hypothetical protein